ncbi:MAG: glycosyltransferase family 4 protein [Phycisphaerales bacterium]|nr:MAG: glycosyltransferase family 4 protein [Phycisphaerales bacterium]
MIRVLHLCDASAGWEHRVSVGQLLARLPADEVEQSVAVVDAQARLRLGLPACRCLLFARRFNLDFLHAAWALRRFLDRRCVDLVHAWGVRAAAVAECATCADGRPVAVTLFHPIVPTRDVRFLRNIREPDRKPILCSADTVRRRLVEQGVDARRCVVIRPGVDFAAINHARKSHLRRNIGLTEDCTLIVTPEPVTRTAGHFAAFWMTAIRSFLDPGVRVVLPGASREQRRLERLARQLNLGHLVICPGSDVRFEDLIVTADVAVVVPTVEISSGSLAWAMAARVPVLGTAVRSVAEMISHDANGLLFKPLPAKRLAARLALALADRRPLDRLAEAARAQAYQVFGLGRAVAQHRRLYNNLVSGRPAGQDIADSARDGASWRPEEPQALER